MKSGGPSWVEGAKVGRYRLVRKLGVGGMVEVHLALAEGIGGSSRACGPRLHERTVIPAP